MSNDQVKSEVIALPEKELLVIELSAESYCYIRKLNNIFNLYENPERAYNKPFENGSYTFPNTKEGIKELLDTIQWLGT